MTDTAVETPLCLERHSASVACEGEVEYRESLSGTGTAIPRCDGHWSARLDEQARIRRSYPDQATPPAWFDASVAGEHWDSDY